MKVATILPQDYLHLVSDDDYHMCLAHLIESQGMELYTEFFKERAKGYIIMDNGLIEGNARPITELLWKAYSNNVNELVLPDVFNSGEETINKVKKSLDMVKEWHSLHKIDIETKEPLKYMAVAHGPSEKEFMHCFNELLYMEDIQCIGIPKVLTKELGERARLNLLKELKNTYGDNIKKDIHLLGCHQSPLEVTMIAKAEQQGLIPKVRGIDSALPFVYARAGLRMNASDRPDSEPINFKDDTLGWMRTGQLILNKAYWVSCAIV